MIKHTISKQSESEVTIAIEADETFITPYKTSVFKRLKQGLKVDGFRPGHAPDNIVERELGEARVQAEVLEEIISHAYSKAIRELKLETIAAPQISLKKFVPYTEVSFEAVVAVMPEIKVDMTKLKLKKPTAKVEAKEIDDTLDGMLRQTAQKTETTKPLKKSDVVTFDFDGTKAGKPVEGASAKGHVLTVGEGSFIPGFEDNMIGLKSGDTKTFTVTFPKDYHAEELKGQPVEFTITIHKVEQVTLPKADDAWAKTVGPVKDLAQLREEIKNTLAYNKQSELDKQYENDVLEAVVKSTKVVVPQSLVQEQATRLRTETEENLKNSGLDLNKYLKLQKQTPEVFDKQLNEEAEKRVKLGLVLRAVIAQEGITVSDTDVDAELTKLKAQYTDPKMQEEFTHGHFKDDLRNHLLTQKAVEALMSAAAKS